MIILTGGTYDLFHIGHLNFMKKCKILCDYLIVAVSTDMLVKSYKNYEPIIPYEQRIEIIRNLECVDEVVRQDNIFDVKQFKDLEADKFAVGDDWKENYTNKNLNWFRDNDKIIFLPYTKDISTTNIKEKIIKNSYDIIKSQLDRERNDK